MNKIDIKSVSKSAVVNVAVDTVSIRKQAIVFVNTKVSAEKAAEDIAGFVKSENERLVGLSVGILKAMQKPTKQCERLARCVRKGVAFHHAGLVAKQREIIEEAFRAGEIKVVCSTPTLAIGVDLPAFRVIIKDLKRYGGSYGMSWIPVLEYLQQSGRAGRPKFDSFGESVAIAGSEKEKDAIFEKYIRGEPEEILSKLAVEPVLRTYILSLIASDFVSSRDEIMGFFEKTFWASQYGDMRELELIVARMLGMLEEWGFLEKGAGGSDFVSGDEFLDFKVSATVMGKRVAELYIDPMTAHFIIECMSRACKGGNAFGFLQMASKAIEMRPLLRVGVKELEEIESKLDEYRDFLLDSEPYDDESYYDFINSIKTALFFEEWVNEKDEEELLEKYRVRPGEIRAKIETADWVLYSAEEICKLLKLRDVVKDIAFLRIRMKHGVKEELIPLLKLKGIGRVRARKLFSNNVKTIGDVKRCDLTSLVQILGAKTAVDVKEQVGEKPKKAKVNKRKGQISLMDY